MSIKDEVTLNKTKAEDHKGYFTYQTYVILFLLGLIIIFLRSADISRFKTISRR